MPTPIKVDPALVERYIFELAKNGAYGETGVSRQAYTPEWSAAQDQIAAWCRDAGLAVRRDMAGNIWGRLDGTAGGKVIGSGSHIDTVCPGGRYDGALGVIAALVAVRTLKEQFGAPKRPLEVVSFCEEESSRFPDAAFWGSRAVTGIVQPDEPTRLLSFEGDTTIGEAMRSVGLDPNRIREAIRDDIDTFIELHIEQGPVLEKEGLPVGIVTAINGMRDWVVELVGRADHAGGMPMDLRRDPMAGAAEIITGIIQNAVDLGRPAVTTVGQMAVEPNHAHIVPGKVQFTINARHVEPATFEKLCADHEKLIRDVAERRDLQMSWHIMSDIPPVVSDQGVVQLLEGAAAEQGLKTIRMQSGPLHDTSHVSRIAKVAMIFVQSKGGRSHSPVEFTSVEHAVAGIDVLATALHKLAY